MRKTLIVGATSAIAQATARLFAADGASLFLVARDERKSHLWIEGLPAVPVCGAAGKRGGCYS